MRDDVMHIVSTWWRSLVFGLAAAVLCGASAFGQSVPLAERIQLCGACHGEDGNSRMENIPSLAGQPEFFILNQLFLMREGVRRIEVMMPLVKDCKDDEMDALAKHFSKLAPKASDEAIDPARRHAEVSLPPRCAAGPGTCPLWPDKSRCRACEQRIDYMIHAMKQFRDEKRSGADTPDDQRRARKIRRRSHRARALCSVPEPLLPSPDNFDPTCPRKAGAGTAERDDFSSNRHRAQLLLEHDLFRKPVPTPDQVRGRLFRIML